MIQKTASILRTREAYIKATISTIVVSFRLSNCFEVLGLQEDPSRVYHLLCAILANLLRTMMMSPKFLGVVLLTTFVAAEIPSYFKICGRRDPNLDRCVLSAVDGLRDKFRTGIPELDAPPLDPLYLEGFPLSQTDVLRASARNVTVSGLSNFEGKSFHPNFESKRFEAVIFFKRIVIDADYDVKARLLVPIARHGPIHIVTDDVRADVTLGYKLIKKSGTDHIFFNAMTTKLIIKDYTADFRPTEQSPDNAVATAINAAIQGGRQEIIKSITPNIEKVISSEVLKIANTICKHFTFDELFPDRE